MVLMLCYYAVIALLVDKDIIAQNLFARTFYSAMRQTGEKPPANDKNRNTFIKVVSGFVFISLKIPPKPGCPVRSRT
jgi:hypothetical protein